MASDQSIYKGTDVPKEVSDRAYKAVLDGFSHLEKGPENREIREITEKALKDEFGDARFVMDTINYDAVY